MRTVFVSRLHVFEALCTGQRNYQEKFTADRESERGSEIFTQMLQLV